MNKMIDLVLGIIIACPIVVLAVGIGCLLALATDDLRYRKKYPLLFDDKPDTDRMK